MPRLSVDASISPAEARKAAESGDMGEPRGVVFGKGGAYLAPEIVAGGVALVSALDGGR